MGNLWFRTPFRLAPVGRVKDAASYGANIKTADCNLKFCLYILICCDMMGLSCTSEVYPLWSDFVLPSEWQKENKYRILLSRKLHRRLL